MIKYKINIQNKIVEYYERVSSVSTSDETKLKHTQRKRIKKNRTIEREKKKRERHTHTQ